MNEIKPILSTISDYFGGAGWFLMSKWPFWILLFTVAAGGVYTARFGKKTLLCRGISGALNLCGIYQAAVILYIAFPTLRDLPYGLPFLLVSDRSVSLANPMTMNLNVLSPILLQLMFLILLVDFVESLNPGGKTILSWLLTQIVTVTISLSTYLVVVAGVNFLLPSLDGEVAIIPIVIVAAMFLLLLCGKVVFTLVLESGDPRFKKFYGFFTTNKGGSLLTVSVLSFLLCTAVFMGLYLTDCTAVNFASTNFVGHSFILILLLISEYFYAMFYCGKKK